MGLALPIILGLIDGGFKLLANHLGKPEGWKPSQEEWDALNAEVAAATPEAVKADARTRMGLPPEPPV